MLTKEVGNGNGIDYLEDVPFQWDIEVNRPELTDKLSDAMGKIVEIGEKKGEIKEILKSGTLGNSIEDNIENGERGASKITLDKIKDKMDRREWLVEHFDVVYDALIDEHRQNMINILNGNPDKYLYRAYKYQKIFQKRIMNTLLIEDFDDII